MLNNLEGQFHGKRCHTLLQKSVASSTLPVMVLGFFGKRTSSSLKRGSSTIGNPDIFLSIFILCSLVHPLSHLHTVFLFPVQWLLHSRDRSHQGRMKFLSSNSEFLGIVLGRRWRGGGVGNCSQKMRAGADDSIGPTTEGWACMWAKPWGLPNLRNLSKH